MIKIILVFALVYLARAQSVSPFNPPPFTSDPSTCNKGDIYNNTSTIPNVLKVCNNTNTWAPIVIGPASSTGGSVPLYSGTSGGLLLGPGIPISQSGGPGAGANLVQGVSGTGLIDITWLNKSGLVVVNDTITGTTATHLAKIDSSGHAVNALTTDTAVPVFICVSGCTNSGSAYLLASGTNNCLFDAAGGTSGHFVIESTTTANTCHDAGASFPASGWVVGQLLTSPGPNAVGTVAVINGDQAATNGGSGVTSINFTTPVSGFNFTSSTGFPINTGNPTGVITLGFANESAGVAFIGPCTGAATTPAWRTLCYQDIPGAVGTATGTSGAISFDLSTGGVQTVTLTGNGTSATFTNGVAGKRYTFIICGDFTFTWPTGFHGAMVVNNVSTQCSAQDFDALNSTTLYAPAPGVTNQ